MHTVTSVAVYQHSHLTGVDLLMLHPPPSFLFTRLSGVFGQLMAEYVIQQIVNRERGMAELYEDQKKHQWCVQYHHLQSPSSFVGSFFC